MKGNQKKHYVGKFISLFKASENSKLSSIETNNKLYVYQENVNNPISLDSDKVKVFVVTRKPENYSLRQLHHRREKGNLRYDEYLYIHGTLIHHYDELWWFLLNAGYVKLKVNQPKFELNFKNYGLAEIEVYITRKAIKEQQQLTILREAGKINYDKLQMKQEQSYQDYQIFARLSLLLMLDLLNVQIIEHAQSKSYNQFKQFFSFLNKLNPEWIKNPNQTFKPFLRYIIEDKQYFKKYISDQHFHNNLFTLSEIERSVLKYNYNNVLMAGDNIFKPYLNQYSILKHPYYQKLMMNLFEEVNEFIKASMNSVIGNQTQQSQNYYRHVYETIFLGQQMSENIKNFQGIFKFPNSSINNDDYVCQHYDLICNARDLEIIHNQKLFLLDQKLVSLDSENPHPLFLVMCDERLNQLCGFSIEINEDEYETILKQKQEIKQQCLDSLIMLSHKQNNLAEKSNENTDLYDVFNLSFTDQLQKWPTPQQMKTELWPHQKEALYWMLLREGCDFKKETNDIKKQQSLSPFWQEVKLLDKTTLYINIFTAKISEEFQPYQEIKGGILADEMGLGKTIMTLALILQDQKKGNLTIIVVPKSVITQWEQEIMKHSCPNTLKILPYYKKQNRSKQIDFKDFDILLTTYKLLAQEYSIWSQLKEYNANHSINEEQQLNVECEQQQQVKKQPEKKEISSLLEYSFKNDIMLCEDYDSQDEEGIVKRQATGKLQKQVKLQTESNQTENQCEIKEQKSQNTKFNIQQLSEYAKQQIFVLDEAHTIKTRNTLQTKAALALDCQFRWCLTGTPIQDTHDDLFSLIQFLRVETFSKFFWWNYYVNQEEKNAHYKNKLHLILDPITLRRKRIKKLLKACSLFQKALFGYICVKKKKLIERSRMLDKSLENVKGGEQVVHIFSIINKLRMACDHPQRALNDINFEQNSIEDILAKVDQFTANLIPNKKQQQINTRKNQLRKQKKEKFKNVIYACLLIFYRKCLLREGNQKISKRINIFAIC